MKYGDYQLRDDAAYYNSQNVILYPATNVCDAGALHTEDNVRSIVRRITNKSYKLSKYAFRVSLEDNNTIKVAPGEANIQGYHLITNTSIKIKLPNSVEPTAWTLGLSLSYDGSNHVTGDVVNNSKPAGENETFSGAYLYFFDSCQISSNYDNILVLARVWEQNGQIIQNKEIPWYNDEGEISENTPRYIGNGIENDAVNDNVISADKIELKINGARTTQFDAIQTNEVLNLADVSKYDTMKNPIELDKSKYTKPQSFVTDLQDYLNYMPDWYTSKFGDYMTGALRFDQLSIDAKIQRDPDNAIEYLKDSSSDTTTKKGIYHNTAGVIISPRTLGKLANRNSLDYENGGTIMSVIPRSYASKGIDDGNNAGYAALISQKNGDIGVKMHQQNNDTSKISMPTLTTTTGADDWGQLLIENISGSRKSTIKQYRGDTFFDSYNAGTFQFMSASSSTRHPIALQLNDYKGALLTTAYGAHQHLAQEDNNIGSKSSNTLLQFGDGCLFDDGNVGEISANYNASNPYVTIGNLTAYSNNSPSSDYLIPGVRLNYMPKRVDLWTNTDIKYEFPYYTSTDGKPSYIKILPGAYMSNTIVEDYIKVGITSGKSVIKDAALEQSGGSVIIAKSSQKVLDEKLNSNGSTAPAYTIVEQNYVDSANNTLILNKMQPESPWESIENKYQEIHGIYSGGNIGCSFKETQSGKPNENLKTGDGRTGKEVPYTADREWVRFTQYRYDLDNDTKFGGSNNDSKHTKTKGVAYNIEFNTNIANKRSNQIIWNYNGSFTSDSQPVTLSYIHDTKTQYPNSSYYDYNLYLHHNPTYEVRDILRLDGAGLSIHGDVNNPALDNGTSKDLNVTIAQGRIYSSTYNDYAETYVKDDENEVAIEGMLVMLNPETGKYRINKGFANNLVVGVISTNYGMLIGGKRVESVESQIDSVSQRFNFAVGVAGKLFVNVDTQDIKPGDLLISSKIDGLATCDPENTRFGNIVGKALSKPEKVENTSYYRCLMQIMLS